MSGGSALVLGGGGVTGVAWELGMLAGLADAGVDPGRAELVVGTSAGSVVGAQVTTGTPIEQLYAGQLRGPGSELPARIGRTVLARWMWAVVRHRDPRRARAAIGRYALAARTQDEARRRAVIAARLPGHEWPREPRLLVTAVDAASGEFVVFDRACGVSLVDAVAASCAVPMVWPPVTIDGRRYIDGGVRSAANVDLAAGCDRVLVLAPMTLGVARQVGRLPAATRVVLVSPDRAARATIGRNVLDPARRAAAARAGRAQAAAVRDRVASVWGR
ncbi:patatin-like phospholipase family protein [Plantactinospora sp. GCM10030261]|uniref:patatin-like phospholipase family protein n=1 Tax=Plantactinospora sp. GCM10030261 TaxID=3273420 RepID=UPI0036092420